ncbi:hypothetical protein DYH10_04210 [Candidatus Saccharibacteria bacterium CPR2]|nr:hypothetical protein [Candidatus Saccharibacteria bacterium CPR2]
MSAISITSRYAKINSLVKMTRPQNMRFTVAVYIVSGAVFGLSTIAIILGSLIYFLLYGLATIINNIRDVEVDKLNKTNNPLAKGNVSIQEVKVLFSIYLLGLIIIQLLLPQPETLIFALTLLFFSLIYSWKVTDIQSRGLIATILLSLMYSGSPVLLAGIYSGYFPLFQACVLGLLTTAGLLAKDYKDIKGDKLHGKLTPLVRYGEKTVRTIAYTVGIIALIFVFYSNSMNLAVYITLSTFYLSSAYWLHKNKAHNNLIKILHQTSVVFLVVFYLQGEFLK